MCGVLGSMGGMFWIISGAQYMIRSGEITYSTLPVSISGCNEHEMSAIISNVTEIVTAAL